MSDASSGGGYGAAPKKKVVRRKQTLTAVGQRGPTVAPKVVRKSTPASGVSGSVKAAGTPTRVSSTSRKPLVRSPLPGSGSPLRDLATRTKILYNDPRYRKGMAGMLKPVDTSASKAITDVTRKFPKGVLAAGAGVSEGIRRLQGATDVSNAGVLPFGPNSIPERIARNAPKDAANVVVNSIPSTVHIISDAIRDQQDTLGRHGITRVGHDLADPYVELAKHPGKTLIEKPVSTALLVTGPIRGLSRGVGAVARRGVLGKAAKAAATTDAEAATTAENTRIADPRRRSPDPVGKGAQLFLEKRKLKKIAQANRQAAELDNKGHHAEAASLRNEAAQGHPTRVSEDQVKRRVDELVGINETVRRRHAGQVDQAVDRAVKNTPAKVRRKPNVAADIQALRKLEPGKSASVVIPNYGRTSIRREANGGYVTGLGEHYNDFGDLARAVEQGQPVGHHLHGERTVDQPVRLSRKERRAQRVKPDASVSLTAQNIDLTRYKADLEQAYAQGDLTPRQKASNREARAQVQDALDHPQDPVLVAQAARAYRAVERPITAKLVKYKMLDPEEAAKRRELPFAVQSLRATRDAKPRLTAEGTQRLVIGRRIEEAKANFEDPAVIDRLIAEGKALKKATKGKPDRRAPGFVDEHGNPLSAAQIRAERLSGAEDAVTGKLTRTPVTGEPAYVSHMPGLLKGGSFFRDSARPVSIGKKPFTGATVTKTGFDASPDALHASARRLQSLVDAHEGHLRVLDEMSLRDSKGRAVTGTREQVQAGIDRATLDHRGNPKPGARNYRIVAIHPFGARAAQLDELVNQLNRHGEMVSNAKGDHNPVLVAMEDALAGKGNGPFAAIPEEAAHQMEQHLRVPGSSGGHVWQVFNTLWRKNVLAFSVRWGLSNITEASVRSLVAGVRPGDRALLMKTLDEWMKDDPDAAEAFLGSLGTGHYGFVNRTQRHASAEEFMDPARHGPFVRNMARIAGTINRTPVINWVPKAWSAWTSHVMDSMGRIEGQFKVGLAGKKLRDLHQESRAFADTSEKAVREALQGLKGTPSQIEVARFTRRAYGKYEAHSPQMRKWIEMYTPFVAWTWNATKFIFNVLPRDHPVLTAFMADLANSQEKWLKDVGLWIGERNTLPSYMLGDIPTGGGLLNVAKDTPASLLQDPLETAGSALLPSVMPVILASKGLDPFGQPLKESRESAVLKSLLGFAVPGPILSPGSSGILGRLNPAQVIPASRVDYARTKATLDRIQQQITTTPADKKATPEYRALLDEQATLQAHRDGLLVKAGLKTDPAINVREPLRLLRRQVRDLPASQRGDKYGEETPTYAGLKSSIAQLDAVKTALMPAKKKTVKLRKRPKSDAEKLTDQLRRDIEGATDPAKALRDQLTRDLERMGGG